ncbi:MAG: substrate-binding domain-containing protein [Candidatus Marinarcus sp.]|uniref:substrate-binding domain-containing protein n=1 Tax=Candidatus Marinarcus sp. TaxID=3100987 RepID=UPI003AFFB69D
MKKILFTLLTLLYALTSFAQEKPTLLFYCGITMVKPIKEMAKIIEKKHNCIIQISQGGSEDLYDSLKYSQKGDLYLPGSDSYRKNNLKDGFLLDAQYIGYNQAVIFVQKGNPKQIKSLDDLTNKNNSVMLCDPNSGSIGRVTKLILTKYKGEDFFFKVYDNASQIGTDSRNINKAFIEKKIDVSINWRASASWSENANYIDTIDLNESLAPKKNLVINLLSFSQHKDIAKDFMQFAASQEGKAIMKKYGFL